MSTQLILHVVTPLHVGVGQGIGGVGLPVARQKPYEFPYISGSTLKGCLRACFDEDDQSKKLFGSEPEKDLEAGDVFFGDAQLVVMPVRDAHLSFVWLTCPLLLKQARRVGLQFDDPTGEKLKRTLEGAVDLETVQSAPGLVAWVQHVTGHSDEFVRARVFCVSDDEFCWAAEFATQIDVRNRIDLESGVVVKSALWSEESLAPETILVAPLLARDEKANAAMSAFEHRKVVTLGGKNTIGRGVCRIRIHHGEAR
jgi:CRISPR-associated protein Cmr4